MDRVEQVGNEAAIEFAGKTIVVILPDCRERYLSTALYDGLVDPQTGL